MTVSHIILINNECLFEKLQFKICHHLYVIYSRLSVPTLDWYPVPVGIPVNEVPEYCEAITMNGITWPRTREGQMAASLCPEGKEGTVSCFRLIS